MLSNGDRKRNYCLFERFRDLPRRSLIVDLSVGLPYLHHFEVRLWCATLGADPIVRNVLPPRSRHNVVVRPAFGLVIDESTGHALPLTHHASRREKCLGTSVWRWDG